MNNSQKTVYLIAIIALVILAADGVYSNRIYNGLGLVKNVMISLNTDDAHGVSIVAEPKLVSFESGFVYNLDVSNFPNPENQTVSVAIPIKHLKPQTTYSGEMKFNLETNAPEGITIKTNSGITIEQAFFEADIDFQPVTINKGSKEYVVELNFDTNEAGVGYVILDFKVDDSIDTLHVELSNVIINNFKEIKNDNVDAEQASETSIEII